MLESIPQAPWQVHAHDPLALTQVLGLPGMIVTSREADEIRQQLIVFCTQAVADALGPTCGTLSTTIHNYAKRCVRDHELPALFVRNF